MKRIVYRFFYFKSKSSAQPGELFIFPNILKPFENMLEALEDHDDVQNVYHNVELPDEDEE